MGPFGRSSGYLDEKVGPQTPPRSLLEGSGAALGRVLGRCWGPRPSPEASKLTPFGGMLTIFGFSGGNTLEALSWDAFGIGLESIFFDFEPHLGKLEGSKSMNVLRFLYIFEIFGEALLEAILDLSWHGFGPRKRPKMRPRWSQVGPKTDPEGLLERSSQEDPPKMANKMAKMQQNSPNHVFIIILSFLG